MLRLRSSISLHRAADLVAELQGLDGVSRIVSHDDLALNGENGKALVLEADVEPAAADVLLGSLAALGVSSEDYVLARVDTVAPVPQRLSALAKHQFAWVEVLGDARENSRPLARYLALINVAAVIAAIGVITANSILIVGAMAVSPDLLPICATCVGLIAQRPHLARRAFFTLAVGLLSVVLAAAALTAILDATGVLPAHFAIGGGGMSSLAKTTYSTVLIALAAGVAAILTFEHRTSAAVGVAISVTTIPAAAYTGVALGSGESGGAGALVVLLVNVALLLISGSGTLAIQERLRRG